jgi:ferredoxin
VNAPLTDEENKFFTARHHEEVMCSECKEWTEFGNSCCGMTECESECPVCIEEGFV